MENNLEPNRHVIAALPCLLPISTTLLIFVVVFLHRTLGYQGATLHDFSTLIGSLFTIAAYLYMTSLLWGPAGLFMSILLSGVNTSGRYRLVHPLGYAACCTLAVLVSVLDPYGTFSHFID